MQKVVKKSFMSVVACLMACMMFAVPVFAASNNFSKTTVKLNAINGGESRKSTLSSGSVTGNNPSISKVQLYCNVSSGSDPYTIYVLSPKGTTRSITGPSKSGTITITGFEGENPSGTWTIWIKNSGVSYKGNIYPTSTVTITLKVAYSY